MKRLVSSVFLSFLAFHAIGQYGHEWIQYDQRYFKIPVAREGIHRMSHTQLQEAGVPASADPRTFQLFHRGVEQAIIVQGEDDGSFDPTDYIDFYGKGNDGTLDSALYENVADQPHRYYNLYSDTTSYFLTFGSQTGKRIPTYTVAPDGRAPETHHLDERLLLLTDSYSSGIDYGSVHKTVFDTGEGWTGVRILQNQEVTYLLDGIAQAVSLAGKPQLEVLLTGRGPMNHHVELYAGGRLISTVAFSGYNSYKHTQPIEWSDIDGNGKLSVKIRVTGAGGSDRVSAGYLRLTYPQQITMSGASKRVFNLPSSNEDPVYLEIESPPPGVRLFDVTDPSGLIRIGGVVAERLEAVVPSGSRKILAASEVTTPAWIKGVAFRQISPSLHNYVIITHHSLRKPAVGYTDPVKAYAEYRSFPEGGGFDTLIVNIDQLYDQFNYGEPSPRAIFQFMKFFGSVKLPDYLFLIGKGLDVNYGYRRNPSAFTLYKDLVPSAGFPASDIAYSAGLSGIPGVPAVPTGRLTANTPTDVAAYLNKVKERDALPFDDLGRKRILHLSGGIEDHEPALFRDILQGFESVAEDFFLGGDVQALAKQSTDIKLVNIAEKVNAGLGLITFFGHSAPNTLDFDIGLVTDPLMGYDNTGKYPFLLMNGCDVGSFFLNTNIFGENWIKTPDKGAIGFIAHSSYGQVPSLQRYSSTFYDVAFGDSAFIQRGVGKIQQEVANRYVTSYGSSPQAITTIQQMVLLGDPAVKVFGAQKPDYAVDGDAIFISSFDGESITALTDSFRVHIPIHNFGIASEEDIRVEITREYHDGVVIQYDSMFSPVLFSDTITMIIRKRDDEGYGINSFSIRVDAGDDTDELNETNNIASYEYFIPLNSTRNLYPYDFGIVQRMEVDISFQHTNLLSGVRDFILEVDTASTFDSDYRQQFQISADMLARQRIGLLSSDSLVYYWRTRLVQPLESESDEWDVSSFTYILSGGEGWAQLKFPQHAYNESDGLTHDPLLKRMEFTETVSDIAVRTFSAACGKPRDSVSLKINGVEFNLMHEGDGCRENTINLVAFDKRSTQPYAGIYFKWYELLFEYGGRRLLCGREPYIINSFKPEELVTGNQDDVIQYVDNVKAGDSVVLFNIGDAGYSLWPAAAKTKLGELGISAAQIADLQDGDAVIIFGRKGSAPGSARIFHAGAPETSLAVNKTIAGRFASGSISSPIIGPAKSWDRLILQIDEVEPSDTYGVTVVGIQADKGMDTLRTNLLSNEDLAGIDAEQYPYLKIILETGDEMNLTSIQLKKWMVMYESVPEGLVFYRGPADQHVVAEGDSYSAHYGFVNISEKSFSDSLTVRYDLLNAAAKGNVPAISRKISAPAPGDTTVFTVTFNTVAKAGINDLEVFVNPQTEPESTYENNRIILPRHLNVLADDAHPVLDVTFDGRYLQDNDFVASTPRITIRLWDENPFIRKRDTLDIRIFLSYPCSTDNCGFERIYFSSDELSWNAASETADFTAGFSPSKLADGRYVLRVEASDATGNTSGITPYEISFRVEDDPSVIGLAPYPNPFYYATTFDVIITGDTPHAFSYHLKITDISGKPIVDVSGSGAHMHIGKNSISWDGTGMDGKRLPNGIYFFRLCVGEGDMVEEYSGKVVLLR
jgi:hypothetical protein